MIHINSWECGKGKTRDWIYPKIKQLLALNEKVLLVVPSIELQNQYNKEFNRATVINSNTTDDDSVKSLVYEAVSMNRDFICITHQAFILCNLNIHLQNQYHLIIDEVFDPVRFIEFNPTNKKGHTTGFRYSDYISIHEPEYINVPDKTFIELTITDLDPNREIDETRDNKKLHRLCDEQYISYMNIEEYKHLVSTKIPKKFHIAQVLNPAIMINYKEVYVAGARFEITFMSHWLNANNMKYIVEHKFNDHRFEDITYHLPSDDTFRWTRNKREKYPTVLHDFHAYIKTQPGKFIGIKNVREKQASNDVKYIGHNVHGVNKYKEYDCITIESACNPSYEMSLFYRQYFGITPNQVLLSFDVYKIYQSIMRTAIREHQPIQVFLLDMSIYYLLQDFLPNQKMPETYNITPITKKTRGPSRKKLTDHEKKANRAIYDKKRRTSKKCTK